MELNGFVKVFRKLKIWGWYKNSPVKDVFIHCLLSANFKDCQWEHQTINAGQFVTSRKHLAEELGFSEQVIRTAIKKLESTGEITSKTTNKYTVITVVNWEEYQGEEKSPTNNVTNNQPTTNQQLTNNQPQMKNNKNRKNKKNSEKRACAREIPLLFQISDFVKTNGLNVDAEKFFKHYSERDWLTADGNPIDDWQSVVISWHKKELKPYLNGYSGVKKLSEE